jgi:S1-C subfamily serine protease
MRWTLLAAIALLVCWAGSATAAPAVVIPAVIVPQPLSTGTETRPVQFARLVTKLSYGAPITYYRAALLCVPAFVNKYEGRDFGFAKDAPDLFREVMEGVGFKVVGDSNAVFQDTSGASAEFSVGGAITRMRADVCVPYSGLGDSEREKGSVLLDVEWEIYSNQQRKVVAKIATTGGAEIKQARIGLLPELTRDALRRNLMALAASDEYRGLLVGRALSTSDPMRPASQTPIAIMTTSGPRTIPDAVGSVVAIFTGVGHGSGFLVSSDGYLLSNQHVVGDAKYVKVRWSDGFETVGEVIRSDPGRDVALIKTDPHGRQPLALRRGQPAPGETVFAIGTPLDPKFQSTVTRGVVSANRIYDGFKFLQSDTVINGGNSGGPLLDENGAVVAISTLTLRMGDAPTGINFFIPIGDALDFLALKPQT